MAYGQSAEVITVKIDITNIRVECQYCKCWNKAEKVNFATDHIGVECAKCGTTMCYNICQEGREKDGKK
jgi:hypothetical protein